MVPFPGKYLGFSERTYFRRPPIRSLPEIVGNLFFEQVSIARNFETTYLFFPRDIKIIIYSSKIVQNIPFPNVLKSTNVTTLYARNSKTFLSKSIPKFPSSFLGETSRRLKRKFIIPESQDRDKFQGRDFLLV